MGNLLLHGVEVRARCAPVWHDARTIEIGVTFQIVCRIAFFCDWIRSDSVILPVRSSLASVLDVCLISVGRHNTPVLEPLTQ